MLSAYRALAAQFPPLGMARKDGLLCAGGDLAPARVLAAYSLGIFPWYEQGLPVLWWSPDPRCIMPLESFHLPERSRRALRQKAFTITLDAAFGRVIRACAAPRKKSAGTWIIPEMIRAYSRLFDLGYAHSVEVWDGENLAGGLYGVALGKAFLGNPCSMPYRKLRGRRLPLLSACSGCGGPRFSTASRRRPISCGWADARYPGRIF